ncbi:MAG: Cytochrome c oxidase assembly protein CtaG [Stenotrophomonas maltophilia]|nr:MAG: Cytochrome c oxidase assembly protein CtaG [Stenotrophomonas maltophilia]
MSDGNIDTRKLVTRLLLVVVAMFAFGFALVPIYNVMCKALGINGKTAGSAYQGTAQTVDATRQVKVDFVANNNIDMVWEFRPEGELLSVHPGAVNQMLFDAYNPTDKPMTAQAIPSIAPATAARYFHKTECFCFTQQVLQPGQRIRMPVRFIVDRDLPADVHRITLAYTLFDITARKPPVASAAP